MGKSPVPKDILLSCILGHPNCVRLPIPGRMKWQMRLSWGRCEFGSSRSYDESGRSRRGWVRRRRNWLCCTDPTRSEAYKPCQKIDCGEKLKANCISINQFLIGELQHKQWDLTTFQKPKWQNGAQRRHKEIIIWHYFFMPVWLVLYRV